MEKQLQDLRNQIDTIDTALLELLQKRIIVMEKIGNEKKLLQKPIRDEKREKQKLLAMEQKAKKLTIPERLVKVIWKLFFDISEEIEK